MIETAHDETSLGGERNHMGLSRPLSPMLLSATKDPFDDPNYLYEWKVDGIRCVVYINDGRIRLFSRHGLECTQAFPELHGLSMNLRGKRAILDGELCVMVDGKPSLDSVMERYMAVKSVPSKAKALPASLITWDILELDGKDLSPLSLINRKEFLEGQVISEGPLTIIDSVDGLGTKLFDAVCSMDLEGIVAKKKSSKYKPGTRSKDWIKIKNWKNAECVILGYKLGDKPSILLGDCERGAYIGAVEHGLSRYHFKALEEVGKQIELERQGDSTRLEPLLRCTVRHVGWSASGHMRDLYFEGFNV